jgi:hypothetical protein
MLFHCVDCKLLQVARRRHNNKTTRYASIRRTARLQLTHPSRVGDSRDGIRFRVIRLVGRVAVCRNCVEKIFDSFDYNTVR